MATYTATITWRRGETEAFTDNRYSRGHEWAFDGGARIRASSSPHVVPKFSDAAGDRGRRGRVQYDGNFNHIKRE